MVSSTIVGHYSMPIKYIVRLILGHNMKNQSSIGQQLFLAVFSLSDQLPILSYNYSKFTKFEWNQLRDAMYRACTGW